ncbi:MAG: proline--tRNA ligase [Candidatus Pacebacteria bacterium CG_4_10_14_0_8_um_filter_43_12]|nr:MAG: proline--tRNA ligase [Candidatus Pacebacteria bacterium CG10_big_fil_rev_8_21_14_0_10_44_11]PIY79646.1 MAG: proline--tRNA ligase [Candidatus Pacebacteria bacterium CG_4_10_14_0_8_um_filter_43_12]
MRYSQLYTKTLKVSKSYRSVNATLLIKGGFIDQTMAGVYSFLPLGLRVLNKIEQITREEMDKIATEVLLPALSPKKLWIQTGRLNTVDVLMKTAGANEISKSKNTNEYVLNCTHEDVITPLVQKFNTSYKDFPVALYQIQSKFRNEARAKSGLLRGREFRMKDLYSFHVSESDLKEYYEKVKAAYVKVYERVGLGEDTVVTLASGGDFTKAYSHEFQTLCESGEDLIFFDETTNTYYNKEVAPSQAPAIDYDGQQHELKEVYGEHITGIDALVKFLQVPATKCVKTLIYQTETDEVIVAAVRGNYEINEIKLRNVVGCNELHLASEAAVKKTTTAQLGYAGLLNLPAGIRVFVDESIKDHINFECGANKDNYHSINVNWGRDVQKPEQFYDIKVAQVGDLNPANGKPFQVKKTSEVGNIFPLGTKYTKAFNYTFTDQDGQEKFPYMGSYGLGTSRLMGVLVEKFHDDKGILWPSSVAPFQVHLVSLTGGEQAAQKLYQQLTAQHIDVLWDDRAVSAGEKFAAADLIGVPVRLIVSAKTGEQVEWKKRAESTIELISVDELLNRLDAKKL